MIDETKKRIIDETIVSSLVGQRIDRVISLVADIPRAAAAQIIDAGAVLLDDVIVKAGKIKVTEGQHLVIDLTLLPEKQLPAAEPNIKVDVVYADDDLIVIVDQLVDRDVHALREQAVADAADFIGGDVPGGLE